MSRPEKEPGNRALAEGKERAASERRAFLGPRPGQGSLEGNGTDNEASAEWAEAVADLSWRPGLLANILGEGFRVMVALTLECAIHPAHCRAVGAADWGSR